MYNIASGYAVTGTTYYYTTDNGLSYTAATNIAYTDFATATLYTYNSSTNVFTAKTETTPVNGTAYYAAENLNSYYPRANWNGGRNNQVQTKYLQNAAYCRLKNLTIGYTLPQQLTQRFYVQNLRVFFSAENLFTITDFTKLGDPEIIDASGWGFSKTYPLTKNFAFGVSVTL